MTTLEQLAKIAYWIVGVAGWVEIIRSLRAWRRRRR